MPNFNSVLYEILGAKIKARREELGINQNELGDKAGIGRTSISNIEQGRQKPPLSIIYKICSVLLIDVHQILPTHLEVEQKINSVNEQSIQNYLQNYDIDPRTLKEINKYLI